jgi:hypothetical protein
VEPATTLRVRSLVAALAIGVVAAGTSAADEAQLPPLAAVPTSVVQPDDADGATRAAALEEAFRSTEVPVRVAGAQAAATADHARLGELLLKYLGKEKEAVVRLAVIDALGSQRRSEKKVFPRLHGMVEAVVAARAEVRKRSKPPVPLQGGALAAGKDAAAAVAARRAQSHEVACLVRALRRLGTLPKDHGVSFAELLLDADDRVVVEVLDTWSGWKPDGVYPAIYEIYARYPTEYRWEGGHVIDLVGDDLTARAMWEARHGDPLGKRPRPLVVRAIRACLKAMTDKDFATPADFKAWMSGAAGAPPAKGAK